MLKFQILEINGYIWVLEDCPKCIKELFKFNKNGSSVSRC